jgi:hypothetical protein
MHIFITMELQTKNGTMSPFWLLGMEKILGCVDWKCCTDAAACYITHLSRRNESKITNAGRIGIGRSVFNVRVRKRTGIVDPARRGGSSRVSSLRDARRLIE